MTKAHFQPMVSAISGTVSGAMMAPTLEPELKIPVARARSRCGNHSAVVLMAAGKLPASVTPRNARATLKPKVLLTNACPMAAKLHRKVDRA